jgi:hypothetical protein
MLTGVERIHEPLRQYRPNPHRPLGKTVGQAEHRPAHKLDRNVWTVTNQMTVDQPTVELRYVGRRHPVALELPQARRHAIHSIITRKHPLNPEPALTHTLDRHRRERHRLARARNAHQLRQRQALAVNHHRHRAQNYRLAARVRGPNGDRRPGIEAGIASCIKSRLPDVHDRFTCALIRRIGWAPSNPH